MSEKDLEDFLGPMAEIGDTKRVDERLALSLADSIHKRLGNELVPRDQSLLDKSSDRSEASGIVSSSEGTFRGSDSAVTVEDKEKELRWKRDKAAKIGDAKNQRTGDIAELRSGLVALQSMISEARKKAAH